MKETGLNWNVLSKGIVTEDTQKDKQTNKHTNERKDTDEQTSL